MTLLRIEPCTFFSVMISCGFRIHIQEKIGKDYGHGYHNEISRS